MNCVFNHKCFFANIQADDRVVNSSFKFDNEQHWKAIPKDMINMLPPPAGVGYLMPSSVNATEEEVQLEGLLREVEMATTRAPTARPRGAWPARARRRA